MASRSFPDGFGAQITAVSDLDTNDGALYAIDGLVRNVAPSAGRGCAYTAANTGSAYTATRTILNEDFLLTVTANTTITLAGGGLTGEVSVWNIVFVQDATGGRTIAVSDVTWVGGTPTFAVTTLAGNHCSFVQHGTGDIYGYYGGTSSGLTIYVSDTFTRANAGLNGAAPETGTTAWAISDGGGAGVFGVVGNKAQKTTAGGAFESVLLVESGESDCTITCDVTYATATNGGLAFRGLNSANFNLATLGGGNLAFYTVVASSYVEVASSAGLFTNGVTYAIKIVLLGTSVKMYVDDVLKIDTTSSSNQARTLHGLRVYNETSTIFDNFLVTS